jgi:Tfp pilus assembly protein PilX
MDQKMKNTHQTDSGSAMMIAVLLLAIITLVGATVVYNCTTRYNAGSKQIKAWNEALYAAEAGSEAAFAEIRNALSSGTSFSTAFPADSWSVSSAPTPGPTIASSNSP